jgi:hypothetical protein
MDHLPNVECKHVEVPFFIQARVFHPEEFFSLLDGKEAGPDLLKRGSPASMSREHCNDFFQRLLFFSVLAQFLGVKVDSAKFKQNDVPQPRLTTRILNKHLRTWEVIMDPENPDYVQEIQRKIRVGLALSEARAFVSKWCSNKRMKKPKANNFDNSGPTLKAPEIDPRLCLSFMILGETLDKALNRARKRRDKLEKEGKLQSIGALQYLDKSGNEPKSWGISKHPTDCMEINGWCRKDIRRIQLAMGDVSSVYFAQLFPRKSSTSGQRKECRFSHCSITRLGANNVQHTDDCIAKTAREEYHICQLQRPDLIKII